MEDTKLIAKKRDSLGSSNARRMRKAGNLPCVIYGEGKAAESVQIEAHAFELLLHHHASETMITSMDLEGAELQVLVKDVQRHPTSGEVLHVDLLKIVEGQSIHVDILLEIVGEAVGVKEGGLLEQVMHSIPIECLPNDLVESIEVDVSALNIGDTLCVSGLNLGGTLKPLIDGDTIVATVVEPRVEAEAGEEAAEGGAKTEPEVITEKKAKEEEAR